MSRVLSPLIDLTTVVTKFFVNTSLAKYKIDPQEQKWGVTIYRKKRY